MAEEKNKPTIFALRTTANREDQVMDFVISNAQKKKLEVYTIVRAHGMRSYIFLEAASRTDAEQAAFNIPYARGILPKEIDYSEIEHMLEIVKVEMNIQKNDIVEIISGPFKRENAKVTRIDKAKEEVVVELLEAAVPIPITVKMDAVKVIRREKEEEAEEAEKEEEKLPLTGMEKPKEAVTEFVMPEVPKKKKEVPKEEVKEEKPVEKVKEKKKPKKKKKKKAEEKAEEAPKEEEPVEEKKEETKEEKPEPTPAPSKEEAKVAGKEEEDKEKPEEKKEKEGDLVTEAKQEAKAIEKVAEEPKEKKKEKPKEESS